MNDKNTVTDLDWAKEVEDVTPLKKDTKIRLDSYEVEDFDDLEVHEAKPIFMTEKQNFTAPSNVQVADSDEPFTKRSREVDLFSGARMGINHDVFQNLKNGLPRYESKLDLHGFKEEEAWGVLNNFLLNAYANYMRCVLIVHGKGKGYGDQGLMGIIKANVCGWLENSPTVLAYHTAQAKHGGSGAVYVLIRRNKEELDIEEDFFNE